MGGDYLFIWSNVLIILVFGIFIYWLFASLVKREIKSKTKNRKTERLSELGNLSYSNLDNEEALDFYNQVRNSGNK